MRKTKPPRSLTKVLNDAIDTFLEEALLSPTPQIKEALALLQAADKRLNPRRRQTISPLARRKILSPTLEIRQKITLILNLLPQEELEEIYDRAIEACDRMEEQQEEMAA